jgi:hypothetical protein
MANLTADTLIQLIRKFLRDTPKLNELRRVQESTDDDIKLAINMAMSDWNSTPPLIAPSRLDNFPSMDWLVMASCMFILQSAGVLQYRNDLAYQDSGITVNPWSKGPQYFNTAGMWAQMVEMKKREFKVAFNYAQTFGVVRTAEFMYWDYAGLYSGPQFNNQGFSLNGATPNTDTPTTQTTPVTPSRSAPFDFVISSWHPDPPNSVFYLDFYHNLMSDVDVRIIDPNNGTDLRNKFGIQFVNKTYVRLTTTMIPDGRLAGQIVAFKL